MWEKSFRRGLFSYLYLNLFWDSIGFENPHLNDLEKIKNLAKEFSNVDFGECQKRVVTLKNNYNHYLDKLNLLISWEKTHLITKAILLTFLVELDEVQDKSNLIGNYLRISQDFGGSHVVSIVHAVLSKLLVNQEKTELA
jgi:transcription termination factor NusB